MPSTNPRTYEPIVSRKVAFLGLGVMGYPMAAHLALAGHQVTVYNRTESKALAWCSEYVRTSAPRHSPTPRLAAQGAVGVEQGAMGARVQQADGFVLAVDLEQQVADREASLGCVAHAV